MSKNLYVGNLNYDTTENTLQSLFAEQGEVVSVKMITDRYSGRTRGFAFVEMATEEAAQAAIGALNGQTVDNRQLRVDLAKPRPTRDRNQSGWGRSQR